MQGALDTPEILDHILRRIPCRGGMGSSAIRLVCRNWRDAVDYHRTVGRCTFTNCDAQEGVMSFLLCPSKAGLAHALAHFPDGDANADKVLIRICIEGSAWLDADGVRLAASRATGTTSFLQRLFDECNEAVCALLLRHFAGRVRVVTQHLEKVNESSALFASMVAHTATPVARTVEHLWFNHPSKALAVVQQTTEGRSIARVVTAAMSGMAKSPTTTHEAFLVYLVRKWPRWMPYCCTMVQAANADLCNLLSTCIEMRENMFSHQHHSHDATANTRLVKLMCRAARRGASKTLSILWKLIPIPDPGRLANRLFCMCMEASQVELAAQLLDGSMGIQVDPLASIIFHTHAVNMFLAAAKARSWPILYQLVKKYVPVYDNASRLMRTNMQNVLDTVLEKPALKCVNRAHASIVKLLLVDLGYPLPSAAHALRMVKLVRAAGEDGLADKLMDHGVFKSTRMIQAV